MKAKNILLAIGGLWIAVAAVRATTSAKDITGLDKSWGWYFTQYLANPFHSSN